MSYRGGPSTRPLAPLQPSQTDTPKSPNPQRASGTPHKPKRVACKECRQAKVGDFLSHDHGMDLMTDLMSTFYSYDAMDKLMGLAIRVPGVAGCHWRAR